MNNNSKTATERLHTVAEDMLDNNMISNVQHRLLVDLIDSKYRKLITAIETYTNASQLPILRSMLTDAVEENLQGLLNYVYLSCPTHVAKKISKNDRTCITAPTDIGEGSLVYGEVSFDSMVNMLWKSDLKLASGGVFYDLGSGIGRGVIGAALLHDFEKCIGIEVLSGLCQESNRLLQRYDRELQKNTKIEFIKASFLDYDWSDGDVIFAHSTCFESNVMKLVSLKAEHLKEGAYVVTFTKELESPYFEVIQSRQWNMSWGKATVHIYKKCTPTRLIRDDDEDDGNN